MNRREQRAAEAAHWRWERRQEEKQAAARAARQQQRKDNTGRG